MLEVSNLAYLTQHAAKPLSLVASPRALKHYMPIKEALRERYTSTRGIKYNTAL